MFWTRLVYFNHGIERENEVKKVSFSAAATEKVNSGFPIPMKEGRN